MSNPQLIAVDWGSSNCRAYLLGDDATILTKIDSPQGILHVSSGEFEQTFHNLIGNWLKSYPKIPVIMSGMVGSQQGWIETPYMPVPASRRALAESLVQVPHVKSYSVHIVPGIMLDTSTHCDVMRGEETQIIGALHHQVMRQDNKQILCLPGTHSKWAYVNNQEIYQFTTYMTGELFSLLSLKSILSKNMAASINCNIQVLVAGFKDSKNDRGLLANFFTIRARSLKNYLTPMDAYDYLSGLLIGHEIHHAATNLADDVQVTLISSESVGFRYKYLLTLMGKPIQFILSEQATTLGLWNIAREAGLIT